MAYQFPIAYDKYIDMISSTSDMGRVKVKSDTRRLCGPFIGFFEDEISRKEGVRVKLKVCEATYYPENNERAKCRDAEEKEQEDEDPDDEDVGENEQEAVSNTIKARSPFTKIFKDISTLKLTADSSSLPVNVYFNKKFVDFLLNSYMPYCFLWASFVLRDYGLTRLTNGLIEIHNRVSKNQGKKKMPDEYINRHTPIVKGGAVQFLKAVEGGKIAKKRKACVEVPESMEYHDAQEEYLKADCITGKASYQNSVVLSQKPTIFKKAKKAKKNTSQSQPQLSVRASPKQKKITAPLLTRSSTRKSLNPPK